MRIKGLIIINFLSSFFLFDFKYIQLKRKKNQLNKYCNLKIIPNNVYQGSQFGFGEGYIKNRYNDRINNFTFSINPKQYNIYYII